MLKALLCVSLIAFGQGLNPPGLNPPGLNPPGLNPPDDAPAALHPPAGQHLLFSAHGIGSQIYVCTGTKDELHWSLKGPEAHLLGASGEEIGRHFVGPTWQAKDGSSVLGKLVASAASPDPQSIPWLLLHVEKREGAGTMSKVLSIQRLHTKGGKAPVRACDASRPAIESRVPYEADYYFYSATNAQ